MQPNWIVYNLWIVCIWIVLICQPARSQETNEKDTFIIERITVPRKATEKNGIQPTDMLISKEAAKVLQQKLDTLETLKQNYAHLHAQNRQLLGQLDSIAIMLKKAEAYAQQIDSKRQSLEYQILQNKLAMIRNEKDILKLRRKILRTLRKEPKIVKKYLLFYDAVPKRTKLFGYAIIGTILILITSPLLTK